MPHCAAFHCNNATALAKTGSPSTTHISFHKFPSDKHLRAIWTNNVKRENFKPGRYSCLCSEHFSEDQFVPDVYAQYGIVSANRQKRRLVDGAIPTIFIFSKPESKGRSSSVARSARKEAASNLDKHHRIILNFQERNFAN